MRREGSALGDEWVDRLPTQEGVYHFLKVRIVSVNKHTAAEKLKIDDTNKSGE